jgi:hypothetical protein
MTRKERLDPVRQKRTAYTTHAQALGETDSAERVARALSIRSCVQSSRPRTGQSRRGIAGFLPRRRDARTLERRTDQGRAEEVLRRLPELPLQAPRSWRKRRVGGAHGCRKKGRASPSSGGGDLNRHLRPSSAIASSRFAASPMLVCGYEAHNDHDFRCRRSRVRPLRFTSASQSDEPRSSHSARSGPVSPHDRRLHEELGLRL